MTTITETTVTESTMIMGDDIDAALESVMTPAPEQIGMALHTIFKREPLLVEAFGNMGALMAEYHRACDAIGQIYTESQRRAYVSNAQKPGNGPRGHSRMIRMKTFTVFLMATTMARAETKREESRTKAMRWDAMVDNAARMAHNAAVGFHSA